MGLRVTFLSFLMLSAELNFAGWKPSAAINPSPMLWPRSVGFAQVGQWQNAT